MKTGLRIAAVLAAALLLSAGFASAADMPVQKVNLAKMVKQAKAATPQVSVAEAKKLIASEKNLLILDVREPFEMKKGKIAGSVNVPRGIVEFRIMDHAKELDRPILVYCASGGRSSLVSEALAKLGYTNVKNMTGGYGAWAKAMKPKN